MGTIKLEKMANKGIIFVEKRLITNIVWEGSEEVNCRIILSTGTHYIVKHDPHSKYSIDFAEIKTIANNNKLKIGVV